MFEGNQPISPLSGTLNQQNTQFSAEFETIRDKYLAPFAPMKITKSTKNTFNYEFVMNSYSNIIFRTSKNGFSKGNEEMIETLVSIVSKFTLKQLVIRGVNQLTRRIYIFFIQFPGHEPNSFSF